MLTYCDKFARFRAPSNKPEMPAQAGIHMVATAPAARYGPRPAPGLRDGLGGEMASFRQKRKKRRQAE
jgi:hypothetical protein